MALLGLLLVTNPVFALELNCRVDSRLFAPDGTFRILDEWKKMSRLEFGQIPIGPAGASVLPKGAELNVLVNTSCLFDPSRGPQALPWLEQLKSTTPRTSSAFALRSFNWTLEQEHQFMGLQEAFEREPCVLMVSPERRYYLANRADEIGISGIRLPRDPFLDDQTHLAAIGYQRVHSAFFFPMLSYRNVTIAVVDTGVDFTHPDLALSKWTNQAEIPGNGLDDDDNGYVDDVHGYNFASKSSETGPEGDWPDNRHGTHVAGLAAARMDNRIGGVGVAGAARVMSLNVFGKSGFTRSSILENAIRYAADSGAQVINLSLGGREYSRTMKSALEYAVARGSFIVTAAGNDGIELCEDPASFDFISPAVYGRSIEGMIVVGSVDTRSGEMSRFSNRSRTHVEINAPGAVTSVNQLVGLLSTTPGNTYGYLAGTSMSSPLVSGTAALIVSWLRTYGYDARPETIERILKSSARRESSLRLVSQEGRTLDLVNLLDFLQRNYPPRSVF